MANKYITKTKETIGSGLKRAGEYAQTHGKGVLYLAGGAFIIILGIGAYQLVTSFSSSTDQALRFCEQEYQQELVLYNQQLAGMIRQNNGQPLTKEQMSSLDPIKQRLADLQACINKNAEYNTKKVMETVTNLGYAAIVTLGVGTFGYLSFKAWINRSPSGGISSASEAMQATSNSMIQGMAENGEIGADEASTYVQQTYTDLNDFAENYEIPYINEGAQADLAGAEAAEDTSLMDSINAFITEVIDTIISVLQDIYIYFVSLFA